jgi:hypothetical protein
VTCVLVCVAAARSQSAQGREDGGRRQGGIADRPETHHHQVRGEPSAEQVRPVQSSLQHTLHQSPAINLTDEAAPLTEHIVWLLITAPPEEHPAMHPE